MKTRVSLKYFASYFRYFSFIFCTFCLIISLLYLSSSIKYLLINAFNLFSRFCLSVSYCVLEANPLVLPTLTLLPTLLRLLIPAGAVFGFSKSILFTYVFKLTKSNFAAKLDV